MSDSGPIYIVDTRPNGDAVVSLSAQYDLAEDVVQTLTDVMSTGRVSVATDRRLAAGSDVTVVVSFPGLLRPLHLVGRVLPPGSAPAPAPAPAEEVADGDAVPGTAAEPDAHDDGDDLHLDVELIAFDDVARSRLQALVDKLESRDPEYVARAVRVLVVEDNPHCAKLIQEGLHLAGKRAFGNRVVFDVPMASNAADAFTFLHSRPIDVLITDIYLGGVSGTTVIEHVRRDSGLHEIPVIAISAGDEATRQLAMAAGADVFLPKPVRLRQIVGTVGRVLDLEQIAWR